MEPLNRGSKCPKCGEKLKARPHVIGGLDHPVHGCTACGLYGVEGDDRVFDRKELGDAELEVKLGKRAVKLAVDAASSQKRYADVPPGKVFG